MHKRDRVTSAVALDEACLVEGGDDGPGGVTRLGRHLLEERLVRLEDADTVADKHGEAAGGLGRISIEVGEAVASAWLLLGRLQYTSYSE